MALRTMYVSGCNSSAGRSLFSVQVNSVKGTEQLYNAIDASDKHLSLYPVCLSTVITFSSQFNQLRTLFLSQDGYHELHNETDDIKNKVFAEYVSWISARLGSGAPELPEIAVDGGMSRL